MIQNIKSPVIFGVISMIIAIIAFILNLKLKNEELERNEIIKIAILGFMVGVMNSILFIIITESNYKISLPNEVAAVSQQFNTGSPNF